MANRDLKNLIASTVAEIDSQIDESKSYKKESESEIEFLNSTKERLLVFFEALQSDEIVEVEKKLDTTLIFLEYMLSVVEIRLKDIRR